MARLTSTERRGLLLTGILMALLALLAAVRAPRRGEAVSAPADTVFVAAPASASEARPARRVKARKHSSRPTPPPERNPLDEQF